MNSELIASLIGISESKEPTSIRARLIVAPMLATFMIIPGTISGVSPVRDAVLISADFPTSINSCTFPVRSPVTDAAQPATAASIRDLRTRSGLTWDELARAFGVSRRTVHAWASGGNLNQAHAARLSVLAKVIDALSADSPARTRAALHAPTLNGNSPYQRLIQSLAQSGNRREGFAPWELLGSREESDSDFSNDQS
jgi:transcriptional regulator with XRE-family HTH domain